MTEPEPDAASRAERHDIEMEEPPRSAVVSGVGPIVESEFASISVRLDEDGNSVRLCLKDLRTGRTRHLDALELEAVIWLEDGHLTQLLDPSHERWRG